MRLPADLRRGAFLSRPNRFTALVDLDGETVAAHVANSGRLRELLQPGNPVYLAPASNSDRKTRYDLTLVELPSGLVSADARLPNALVAESIEAGVLSPFAGYDQLKREVQYGKSRLDMMLTAPNGNCYVEVKSVTLVQEEQGLFPDAPTERGRRHVEELASARSKGLRTAIVFVIQRGDATAFAPHDMADPAFGRALRAAAEQGVEVYAYRCAVSFREIALAGQVPVRL